MKLGGILVDCICLGKKFRWGEGVVKMRLCVIKCFICIYFSKIECGEGILCVKKREVFFDFYKNL